MTAGDFMELITPCSGRAELVAIGAHRNGPVLIVVQNSPANGHATIDGWSHPFAK